MHSLEELYRSAASPDEILRPARAAGRSALLEPEGLALARLAGLKVPELRVVGGADEVLDDGGTSSAELPASEHVVIKAIGPGLVHKSELGAVKKVRRDQHEVAEAIRAMSTRLEGVAEQEGVEVEGYGVFAAIEHENDLAGELILSLRRTPDFGAVVGVGPGGIYAEHLTASLAPGRGLALFSAAADAGAIADRLRRLAVVPMLKGELRGQPQRLPLDRLVEAVLALHRLAASQPELEELELNPVVVSGGELVALDAVARLGEPAKPRPERPVAKLERLLEPRSIAVVGVSARGRNPGRTIVENTLAAGFPRQNLVIVKPGHETLDGCRCVPDVASLGKVDLLVVAVAAEKAPSLLEEVARRGLAESVILIPGGVGEVAGSEGIAGRLRRTLGEAHDGPDGGLVLCGGNCLGVRSRPGRFDTLFIPRHKLALPDGEGEGGESTGRASAGRASAGRASAGRAGSGLALLSQSGAFAIARASQLEVLDPRYIITFGNQMDLTAGDFLDYLAEEPGTELVACYIEGFAPADGERFLRAAERCRRAGRPVILYRAGRTPAGASKAASHTASMAGDYAVTRELASAAGVVLAETLEDFDDLVATFTLLHGRRPAGPSLGAMSNAGFECVAIADHVDDKSGDERGRLRLAELSAPTRRRLEEILAEAGLSSIATVANPLDTTPIFGDEAFAEAARALLEDPGVDVGLVGCVPMTAALATLDEGPDGEDATGPESVASRLADLFAASEKAWAAVVDGGPLYDAMARHLRRAGVPTFRRADRAVRALEIYCRWHASG